VSTWFVIVASMTVGFFSGILSALAGVGGAVVTTPGIRALGAPPIIAVGSTVPAIIPSAITGTIRYHRAGLVRWRVGLWCGFAGMAAALLGVWTSSRVDGQLLMVLTALLVLWSSWSLLGSEVRHRREGRRLRSVGAAAAATVPVDTMATSVLLLVALGLGSGFVAGLLGVGGGIILVPAFTVVLRMPVKETIATSLVAMALMSVASLFGHAVAGHIDWTYALPLAIGVIPGARLGSKVTVTVSERASRLICGFLLLTLGSIYLVAELLSL
jgi:uncharacterized membrane protein YfcA